MISAALLPNQKPELSETELVRLLKVKHPIGMEYLYQNYASTLFGVVLRVVKTREIAEEVLHDAFLKIWSKIEIYDDSKGKLFTWMLNLTRNLAIDQVRSKMYKNENKTDQIEPNEHNIERNHFTMQTIDRIGVEELLRLLKPEHREVVDLMYLKGYTQVEVSEELGIPLGTVKTRIRSAMGHLRKSLGI